MAYVYTKYEAATNAQREALKHASTKLDRQFNASNTGGIEAQSHQFNVDLDASAVAMLDALLAAGYTASTSA